MASDPRPYLEPEAASPADSRAPLPPITWKLNLLLFVATVASVFVTGAAYSKGYPPWELAAWLAWLPSGWTYAVPLLSILLTHEFGHYFAARYHRVDASLPYFIPFPVLSPFGTMGAVISMRGRIKSRTALLDIGASGPLAGLCIAIPVLLIGLSQSPVEPFPEGGWQEGQSLLYLLLKRIVLGPIPAGYDVILSPVAFAGWTGLFVTALNLIPIAQLDGGHIAYALFGTRQNRYARIAHKGLLVMFVLNVARFVGPVVASKDWDKLSNAIASSTSWLFWYGILFLLFRVGGRDHPPTEPGELTRGRTIIAIVSLVFFVLLFMPAPFIY